MPEIRIENWGHLFELATKFDVGPVESPQYWFRGQNDASWPLNPSLARILAGQDSQHQTALNAEAIASRDFQSKAHYHIPSNLFSEAQNDPIALWRIMQHYGAPTRLLDWTTSLFVGSYFACENNNVDGALWVVHPRTIEKAIEEKFPDEKTPTSHLNMEEIYHSEKPKNTIHFLRVGIQSDRMMAQQGTFTVSPNITADHNTLLSDFAGDQSQKIHFHKLLIPADQKMGIRRKLRGMNIMAESLFPSIDGIGRSIKELIELAVYKTK